MEVRNGYRLTKRKEGIVYKTQIFKNKAFQHFSFKGNPKVGTQVGITLDRFAVPLLEPWMESYFPFSGLVVKKFKKSVRVQVYGPVENVFIRAL